MSEQLKKDEILPEYKPVEWAEFLRSTYAEKFYESSRKLQAFEGLDEQEAEHKLMEMLLKSSLLDRFLLLFGEQTADELFEKIGEHVEKSPFSSPEDIRQFAEELSPMFLIRPSNGRMRNSGLGYRLFAQYIRQRLELGDLVNEDTIPEVLEEFYLTIEIKPGASVNQVIFKKKEVLLDLQSLGQFAKRTKGFSYDGALSYSSEDVRLPLVLPVLVYTVDMEHFNRVDKSRVVSGRARLHRVVLKNTIIAELLDDIPMRCFIFVRNIDYGKEILHRAVENVFINVKGHVKPNGSEQFNVIEFAQIEHPMAPGLCTPSRKMVQQKTGPEEADYDKLSVYMGELIFWKC